MATSKKASRSNAQTSTPKPTGALNIAVVGGEVCREPAHHELADGSIRLAFDLRSSEGEVPVTWFGPASSTPTVRRGALVTVVGHVRRHFYRGANGAVASRTDVVAGRVVSGAGKRRAELLATVGEQLVSQSAPSRET